MGLDLKPISVAHFVALILALARFSCRLCQARHKLSLPLSLSLSFPLSLSRTHTHTHTHISNPTHGSQRRGGTCQTASARNDGSQRHGNRPHHGFQKSENPGPTWDHTYPCLARSAGNWIVLGSFDRSLFFWYNDGLSETIGLFWIYYTYICTYLYTYTYTNIYMYTYI